MKCCQIVAAVLMSSVLMIVGSSSAQEHSKDSLDLIKMNIDSKKAVLVDVRENNEWEAGHLENAILLSLSKLKQGAELKSVLMNAEGKPIVYCHCRSGGRALTAAEILRKQGFEVRPLKQGFEELTKQGFPKATGQ